MHYLLISLKSSQLTKKQIEEICELKNQQWKYKLQSQINYYKENIKHNDIHNLFYINNKLIGYTLLRKRTLVRKKTFSIDKIDKSSKYLLFDTLIIDKKFRGKKLSDIIMNFNNTIIRQTKYPLTRHYPCFNFFGQTWQTFIGWRKQTDTNKYRSG